MPKLVVFNHVSLDGYFADSQGDVSWAKQQDAEWAALVSEKLGGLPLAGFNCAGEIGPIGGRNFLHGFTASVALFTDA